MPRVREPTPLGKLFREYREPLGWDRVMAETGLKERAMRTYESGGVMPPLDKALILAGLYGIPLKDLVRAALASGRGASAAATREALAALLEGEAVALDAEGEVQRGRDQDDQKRRRSA